MAITVNIYYTGKDGSAVAFAEEMVRSGTVAKIRKEGLFIRMCEIGNRFKTA